MSENVLLHRLFLKVLSVIISSKEVRKKQMPVMKRRLQALLYIIRFGYWMCCVLQCFVMQVMHQRQFHTSLTQLAINMWLHSWR